MLAVMYNGFDYRFFVHVTATRSNGVTILLPGLNLKEY